MAGLLNKGTYIFTYNLNSLYKLETGSGAIGASGSGMTRPNLIPADVLPDKQQNLLAFSPVKRLSKNRRQSRFFT
jgi:hypothetical protein